MLLPTIAPDPDGPRRGCKAAHMTALTDLDELLAHQIPEPMANVQTHHPHWRESYFFVAHRPDSLGDMVINR